MKNLSFLGSAALALLLGSATLTQAGPVTFTYDFSATSNTIMGDGGKNWLDLSNQAANTITAGATDIVAANLTVHNGLSDTFNGPSGTGVVYTLKLKLTDGPAWTTVGFTGRISGSIDNGNPNLTNVFDTAAAVVIGPLNNHLYTIKMTGFVSPSPFNADPDKIDKGAVGFHFTIEGGSGSGPNDTPEPSTMLLACLGLGGLGLRSWRRS